MYPSLVALALTTSAVVTPDDTLVVALGDPDYTIREWAQGKLVVRASAGAYPDIVARLTTVIGTTQNLEIRTRCLRIVSASFEPRLAQAYNQLDNATGFAYPCIDALIYDPYSDSYDFNHPSAALYNDRTDPQPVPNTGIQSYPRFRAHTRRYAAEALTYGWSLQDIQAELDRMWQIDARYYIRNGNGKNWDGPTAQYVITACRWDVWPRVSRYDTLGKVEAANAVLPAAIPAVMPMQMPD